MQRPQLSCRRPVRLGRPHAFGRRIQGRYPRLHSAYPARRPWSERPASRSSRTRSRASRTRSPLTTITPPSRRFRPFCERGRRGSSSSCASPPRTSLGSARSCRYAPRSAPRRKGNGCRHNNRPRATYGRPRNRYVESQVEPFVFAPRPFVSRVYQHRVQYISH